jgi:nucleoside phosphorylase
MRKIANDPGSETHPSAPIAVFTALAWESAAVRAVLRRVRREGEKIWRGSTGEQEVVVVTGGIGPRRTRKTLEEFTDLPFAAVLSVGCAGALIPGLTTGQLVLASDVRMWSTEEETRLDRFPINSTLLTHTRRAASQMAIPITEGSLFTSARVLFTPEDKAEQGRTTGAIAVEMESGVHAAFATARGLPFLALRVILDPVGMALPIVKGLTTPDGDMRPFKVVSHVIAHPHHFPFLLELGRARASAARSIRKLCQALFPLLREQHSIRR